jgi:thiosulfate reductase/polysulfide reductase chain A
MRIMKGNEDAFEGHAARETSRSSAEEIMKATNQRIDDPYNGNLTRRRFLQWSSVATGALATGGLLRFAPSLVRADIDAVPIEESIRSTCGLCVNKCGIIARVRDGVVHKLDPIPDHPKSHGMLCARGNSGVRVLYDPNRLKFPLIRSGPRGSGQWRQASWEEALNHVAENLKRIREEYGPQAVLFSSTEGFQEHFFLSFAEAWGSPNVKRHPTLCLASMINGTFNTFGSIPEFDFKNSRYVILAGANRFESLVTPDSVDLMRQLGQGARVVVLDPRFTITASKAHEWLPIRPGTDLAFALALLHVIIGEDLHDREFVERYTTGFDELREHVRQYPPEWAAHECNLDAEQIRRIAREFAAAAPRVVFYPGRRSSWNTNDTQFRRAIAIVNAVVGAWDRPGGCIPKASIPLGEPDIFPPDDIEIARCDNLIENFPLANRRDGTYLSLRQSILSQPASESPIKAWMIYKQNPLHSVPESRKTLELMDRMEFIVSIDTMPSDTAWMSDVILPESVYLERNDPPHSISGAVPVVAIRQQVVPPRYDTKPCLEIIQGLAERLDLAEYFDYTIDDWMERSVENLPISVEALKRQGFYTDRTTPVIGNTLRDNYRFRTKSGKIELKSSRYEEQGYDALPVYRPPTEVPRGRYRLLTGRSAIYTHSSLQNVTWLAEEDPDGPRVWMHPSTAARHGIANGSRVRVQSDYGAGEAHAYVTERIRPDCVFVPHGWGHMSAGLSERARRGIRSSDLIGSFHDEISGNAAMHETSVSLHPIRGEAVEPHVPASTRFEGGRA